MIKLKSIRKSMGLTQDDVAKVLNVTRAAYSNLETGKRDPSTDTLIQLASYFNVSVDDLLGIAARSVNPEGERLLSLFCNLNPTGQELLIDYAEMLVAKPAYR